MIPTFPHFKTINVDDRESIEAYTHRYAPYSDFSFTSLWAWDTNEERMISELHGNLVVLFTDYTTHEPSLSFLGTSEVERTTKDLVVYAEKNGISPVLKYIAEETIQKLSSRDLLIEEDRDNFDYILSVSSIADQLGGELKVDRNLTKRFISEYENAHFEIKNFNDEVVQQQILSVLRRWENNKKANSKTYELEHEEMAIRRLMDTSSSHALVVSGVYLEGVMLAFSIDELLPDKYAISHFFKADTTYKGVYQFLNSNVAQYLLSQNIEFWNLEQDLGIEKLRASKMNYGPVRFLKKYKVSCTDKMGTKLISMINKVILKLWKK